MRPLTPGAIAKGVELLDMRQGMACIAFDPVTQRHLQRAVAFGIEGPRRQLRSRQGQHMRNGAVLPLDHADQNGAEAQFDLPAHIAAICCANRSRKAFFTTLGGRRSMRIASAGL